MLRVWFIVFSAGICVAQADVHTIHKAKLGTLTCSLCHVPTERGSVTLKKPGHAQCQVCHQEVFAKNDKTSPVCAVCHGPHRELARTVLTHFSHDRHIDGKARRDAATGFRADCAYCHKIVANAAAPALPTHTECAACHSKPGIRPRLSASLVTSECTGCHSPVEMESQSPRIVPIADLGFSHAVHFKSKDINGIDCTTCHHLADPTKYDCANCHQVMKPASHTARWKDDIHGQFAAIDRASCATCHVADFCVRCHSELPRSHQPLPLFKAGGHARIAMLNQRACMTCHTFENTCGGCHVRGLR